MPFSAPLPHLATYSTRSGFGRQKFCLFFSLLNRLFKINISPKGKTSIEAAISQNINTHCTSKRASQTIWFRPGFKDVLLRLLIATFLFSRFLRHYQYNDLCIWAGHNQKSHTWPSKSSSTLQRAFCFVWNSALPILTLTRPHLLNQCDATISNYICWWSTLGQTLWNEIVRFSMKGNCQK